jgi:hypothetical protein
VAKAESTVVDKIARDKSTKAVDRIFLFVIYHLLPNCILDKIAVCCAAIFKI